MQKWYITLASIWMIKYKNRHIINMTYCIPDFCLGENEEEYVIDPGIEKRSLLLSMYHE